MPQEEIKPFGSCQDCGELLAEEESEEGLCENCSLDKEED